MTPEILSKIKRSFRLAYLPDAKLCPFCSQLSIVPLDPVDLAKQPDETTHVCHPWLGGCNHGFAEEK